ncbi:MAG TPA: M48 family metalloprotease, partial [Planctomycetota bacterium]|nr:M48 family metalloprotease [Planctomycetota bacterium]
AAQHQVQAMSRAGLLQQAVGLTSAVAGEGTVAQLGAGAANVASQLYLLKFSRGEEAQADELGMEYMVKAGYDPHGMPDLLNILLAYEKEAGGGKTPQFLVNHPATDQRVKDTEAQLAKEFGNLDTSKLVKDTPRFDQTVAQMGPAPKGAAPAEGQPQKAGLRQR